MNQWNAPYGMGYPSYAAMIMQRRFELDGATREQIAQIALTARANAVLNPAAVYRDPMTMDDYLDSRMISDPLCLYDCDVPVDGSVAVVVSRSDSSAVDRSRAVAIEAMGTASGFEECGKMLWSRTDLTPADVDVAQLYDGFTIIAVQWLEALGFCGPRRRAGVHRRREAHRARRGAPAEHRRRTALRWSPARLRRTSTRPACSCAASAMPGRCHPIPQVAVVSSGAENFTSALLLTAPA